MSIKIIKSITATIVVGCGSLLFGCNDKHIGENKHNEAIHPEFKSELQLPVVPDSLTSQEERAAYAAYHFWDALDFKNDHRCLDTAFMEQNFSNFLAVLSVNTEEGAQKAVFQLLRKAQQNTLSFNLVNHITNKYLDDPNSPMRNEDFFILFLNEMAKNDSISDEFRETARHKLSLALKNRPGTIASNFRLVTSDGRTTTLHNELGKSGTILMFYDPECENCKEIKERLAQTQFPETIKIIAIDPTGNRNRWERTKNGMPSQWIVGFALDNIDDDEIYIMKAMPTFYIIGDDRKVILKDPAPGRIIGR